MKIFFIMTSCSIVWFMHCHRVVRQTYDREQDTFRVVFLLIPCFLLAVLINNEFTVVEVLWTFSIYLEAVAILPQLVLLQRTKNIDTLTSNYVFLLGGYRSLYLLNWLYRYMTEPGYSQVIVWISGIVQTLLYCDFFTTTCRAGGEMSACHSLHNYFSSHSRATSRGHEVYTKSDEIGDFIERFSIA
jgi:ER lumen protein retaining receptor